MNAEFHCPHCEQPIKVIGIKPTSGKLFESIQSTDSPTPLFEIDDMPPHRARSRRGFWPSMTGTYTASALLAGAVVWLYVWYEGYDAIWAVLVTLIALFGLPITELIIHRPPRKKPKQTRHDIRVRMHSEDGHDTYLDHFQDKTIEPKKLIELAALVIDNDPDDLQWLGRPTVCKKTTLTQTDYAKIADEFAYQGYLRDGQGNTRRLSLRGRSFIRTMASHAPPS